MIRVTLTTAEKMVRFDWNDTGTECEMVTLGEVSDAEIQAILDANGHEGSDVPGWSCEMEL